MQLYNPKIRQIIWVEIIKKAKYAKNSVTFFISFHNDLDSNGAGKISTVGMFIDMSHAMAKILLSLQIISSI